MTDPHVREFIRELNELQQEYGLAVSCDHNGPMIYDPSGVPPNGGLADPIGHLITDSYDDGTFRLELKTDD